MNISKICIERPVLTTVISFALILLGFLGLWQLQMNALPYVFRPMLVVAVNAPGSSAQFVEKNITIPLENVLQTTPYLSFTISNSTQNHSQIKLYFKNITQEEYLTAQSMVLQAVNQITLPQSAQPATIRTSTHDGQQLLVFAISDPQMTQQALVDYVQNDIVRPLQQVPGVGSVQQWSTQNALRINLNPIKMAELDISANQVITALKNNNVSAQAGIVTNAQQMIPININSALTSTNEFANVIISKADDRIIRLKNIATINIASDQFAGAYTYYNGIQGAGVGIVAADDANPIQVGKELRKTILSMEKVFPPGMQIHIIWDQAKLLQHSVEEVFFTIFEAVGLVAVITLLFLGRWRFALIPVVTIPICIISSFLVIWILGFSINLMTLLALVLAVGLVVDDAIVVLENCHRHVENGLSAFPAAIKSMKEITFPVIGMTVSIISVYIPTAFMSGQTAVYFQQFAFTLAGSVFISGIIALTLTPMMCARLMSSVSKHRYEIMLEKFFDGLKHHYQEYLRWLLNHKKVPIVLFTTLLIIGFFIFKALPTTLIPDEYGGYVFLGIQTSEAASVAFTKSIAKKVIADVLKQPSVEGIMSYGGGNNDPSNFGMNFIKLKPAYQNFDANVDVANKLRKLFANMTDAKIFAVPVNTAGQSSSGEQPGQIMAFITGYADYNQLSHDVNHYVTALEKTNVFEQVINNTKYNSQQYNIDIMRNMASEVGVDISSINMALSTFLGGYTFTEGYQFNGVNYPVIVQLPLEKLKDLHVLNDIFVASTSGQEIALNRLIKVKPIVELPIRIHVNSIRAGSISVVPKSQYTTGQAVAVMEKVAKHELPAGMQLSFSQKERDIIAGNYMTSVIFALGIIFIYLILSALFESYIDPLIILLTVPLSIIGALSVLYLIGGSLNIYTAIGLVTLIGLVSKHGVLITQFANTILETEKISVFESVVKSASIRIRPILMTAATMVMGAVPLVLSSGIGSNSRSQIGWVIIAGLLVGTFFSLFIVPVAYLILKGSRGKRQKTTQP